MSACMDKETKLALLTELFMARRSYHRAVARAESIWQEYVYELNLMANGAFEEGHLVASFERAEKARHAIQPKEAAMKAKHAECLALGLDIGVDHALAQAVPT